MRELGLGPAFLGGAVGLGLKLSLDSVVGLDLGLGLDLVVALYLGLPVGLNLYMLYKLGVVFTDRIWYIKRIN